jgi:parallel beta-helix repeat protein
MCHARHLVLVLGLVLAAAGAQAAYVTPGLGVDWTLDDLVANSAGVVTGGGGSYEFHDSVVITVGDRLTANAGATLTFLDTGGVIGLTVNGSFVAIGTESSPISFTSQVATPGAWRGIDYEDTIAGSELHLAFCDIAYADIAIDVSGASPLVEDCKLHACLNRALDFTSAGGTVRRCTLRDNQQRTVTMTLTSSPVFEDCWLENNNIQNTSPYPYFNIGLQGVNSPTIRGCTILGSGHHMSGGISVWASSNALIEDNRIEGCGYGILCYSTGANPTITGNHLHNNTIHPDQVNWGFGVACNGSNAPILTHNLITGHWYGVATINGGQPNLGNLENAFPGDDGHNSIFDNGLGAEIYGFYNNTPLPQMAQGNYWQAATAEEVENAIYHQVDDPALGLVNFDYFITGIAIAPQGNGPPALVTEARAYPNPFNPRVKIAFALEHRAHVSVTVVDLAGRLVRELHVGNLDAGRQEFTWDGTDRTGQPLASGTYFYRVVASGESHVGKLMLVR